MMFLIFNILNFISCYFSQIPYFELHMSQVSHIEYFIKGLVELLALSYFQ